MLRSFFAGFFSVSTFVYFLFIAVSGAIAAPVVLFDQYHEQRFVIEKQEPLHLSAFAGILKEEGFIVRSLNEPFTPESLKNIDAVVISGPFRALDPEEVNVLLGFLERGGRLCAMLHIGSPFAGLLQHLDVDFTNYVLYEQENIVDNDPRNFQVKTLNPDPLFGGLNHFALYGGWALMNTAPSTRIIASTSPKAWVDLNGDRKLSSGDVVQSFGVVAAGGLGAGRFVIFGDDAIFQNKFLDESNRQLTINLARWLK